MRDFKLEPKFAKIEKELVDTHKDPLKGSKDNFNIFVKANAHMIAQGLQLYEKSLDNQED